MKDGEIRDHPIRWASRVPREKIRRLYETDARGIYDEELIDEVGWALWSRCDAFVAAVRAYRGQARCHGCGEMLNRTDPRPDGEDRLHCHKCGWEVSWRAYFKSIQHKQLSGAKTVVEFFEDFMKRFPTAKSPQEKMLLIDWLIHRFHSEISGATRPAGVNLIEGKMAEVIESLDTLTYGEKSTPGTRDTQRTWRRTVDDVLRSWSSKGLESAKEP